MTASAPGEVAFPGAVLRRCADSTAGRLRVCGISATLEPTRPDRGGRHDGAELRTKQAGVRGVPGAAAAGKGLDAEGHGREAVCLGQGSQ